MSTKTLMTIAEFARMHTGETEDFELVEGELIPLSSGTPKHCLVRDLIAHALWTYLRENPIGKSLSEVDCRIGDETVRRPDVAVFLGDRIRSIDLNAVPVPFGPDIAVEVLSPSESAIDVHRKVRDYLGSGSREVWILDHVNGELFVHANDGIRRLLGDDILESPLLPGFRPTVRDLFSGF